MELFKDGPLKTSTLELFQKSKTLPTLRKSKTETSEDSELYLSKERRKTPRNCIELWLLEIFASFLSLVCLVLLGSVLFAIDEKPYESFRINNLDITPNTFVSIISTFGRSCFLFAVARSLSQIKWQYFQKAPRRLVELQTIDDASRGQLGSIKLLCTLRFRNLLASFGAILVILAVASDPFTQQLLSYPILMNSATNQTAFIGASHAFDSGEQSLWAQKTLSYGRKISEAMSGAAFGSPVQVKFDCPSGSCTWPDFDTLGVCTDCKHISDELEIRCQNNGSLCTYSAPKNSQQVEVQAWALWLYSLYSPWLAFPPDSYATTTRLNITAWSAQSQIPVEQDGILSTITGFRFPMYIENIKPEEFVPEAFQCQLRLCSQTYTSRVVEGTLKEATLSSTPVRIDKGACEGSPVICPVSQAADASTQSHHMGGEKFRLKVDDLEWLQINFMGLFQNIKVLSSIPLWTKDYNSFNQSRLSQLPEDYRTELIASNSFTNSGPESLAGELIYQWPGNLSRIFDSVGESLTNSFRNAANSTQIHGDVMIPVVHIHVRWPWLIYFASLSMLAALLLGLCIFSSKGKDEPVWKSAILPLLFHGLGSHRENAQDRDAKEEMEERSRDIRVQLSRSDTGGQFIFREV